MTQGPDDSVGDARPPFPAGGERAPMVNSADLRAGSSCAGGPVYSVRIGADGMPLDFADAFPRAPRWLKQLAGRG